MTMSAHRKTKGPILSSLVEMSKTIWGNIVVNFDVASWSILPKKMKQGHHRNGDQAVWRPHILCSTCILKLAKMAKAASLFMESLHSLQCVLKCAHIQIFYLQPSGQNLIGGRFNPTVWGIGETKGVEPIHGVPISSPLTHMVYLSPFWVN